MIDKRTVCDFCMSDECDCIMCQLGNPCLGCEDYDQINNVCKSEPCEEGKYYDTFIKKCFKNMER